MNTTNKGLVKLGNNDAETLLCMEANVSQFSRENICCGNRFCCSDFAFPFFVSRTQLLRPKDMFPS